MARTLVRLHRRYRDVSDDLAALSGEQGLAVADAAARQPHEEVRDYFYQRQNYVAELDERAEAQAARLQLRPGDAAGALAVHLRDRHDVRVLREPAGRQHEHRFDAERRELRLASGLRPGQAAFRLASQIALLEADELIDDLVSRWEFSDPVARRLARIGLANYYAGALVLPYRAFLGAAERHLSLIHISEPTRPY